MIIRKIVALGAIVLSVGVLIASGIMAQGSGTSVGTDDEKYFLRLSGSNSIGSELAPALVKAWLAKLGAEEIYAVQRKKPDGTPEDESELHATLRGDPVVVEIKAHGSKTGFPDLASGNTDIAMASRRIKAEEAEPLGGYQSMTSEAAEHVLGLDGIAIIVPRTNNTIWLSKKVLGNIFSGAINNWSSLGGEDLPIHLYARDDKSGTYDTFRTLVLDSRGLKLDSSAKRYEDSTQLEYDVSQDPGAVGFVALPYARNTRVLPISDGDANPLEPTRFTIKKEDYTLTRRLYLYIKPFGTSRRVLDFVNFALSDAGQEIVRMNNFVDLQIRPKTPLAADLGTKPCKLSSQWTGDPQSYCRLRKKELLTVVKFESGSSRLDNRAKRDLRDRSLTPIEANPNMKVVLAGFADGVGEYWSNCKLSLERAQSVGSAFARLGVTGTTALGYCPEQPVGDNDTPDGRERNRRVEVYLVENAFNPGPELPPMPRKSDHSSSDSGTGNTAGSVRNTGTAGSDRGNADNNPGKTHPVAVSYRKCNFFETFFVGCDDPEK